MVSWDTYPTWHKEAVIDTAYDNGMCHDLMRSLKGKPFFQMESCPTSTNWQSVSKLKKPGMLFAQSMQAIAQMCIRDSDIRVLNRLFIIETGTTAKDSSCPLHKL